MRSIELTWIVAPLDRTERWIETTARRALLARLCNSAAWQVVGTGRHHVTREHYTAGKSLTRASSDRGTYMGAASGKVPRPRKALRLLAALRSSQG